MKIKLYNYQEIALEKVLYALRRFGRALMVMATGLGKTIVSSKLVELFLSDNPGKRILFLSHDNGILEQSLLKYESIFGNRYSYARFFGAKKDWNADKYDIVFATFQSSPHKLFNADHFGFIIVDESHHSKADTYFECLQYFRPKWKLGMTATPDREDEQDIRSIFGKEVVNYDLPEALANGWLTPVEYKILSDGLDREMLEKICYEVLVENVRITEGQLNDRIFIHARTEEQCNKIVEYTKSGLKAIVFCRNITHLEHVYEILPNSVIVHSERTDDQNYDAEQKYVSGQVSHILVVDKYNEGKDLPDTDVLVFLRGTESYRIWAQQLGRGLRLFPGKEKVVVLDFVANIERIKNVDKLMKQLGQFETNSLTESLLNLNSPLHIEGENFIFDFTSEIVNIFSALERIAMPFYSTWQEASFAAKSLEIETGVEYQKNYKKDCRLHSDPNKYYSDFPGWLIFLEKINIPEGWISQSEAAVSANVSFPTVRSFAQRYRLDHSDWFISYFEKGKNSIFEFYHPEFVKKLKEYYLTRNYKPDGWYSAANLGNELKVGSEYILSLVDSYRKEKPTWFGYFHSRFKPDLSVECFSPELALEVKKIIQARDKKSPQSGWKNAVQISLSNHQTVKKWAKVYKKTNPEWFEVCWTHNRYVEFYHPEFVLLISKKFEEKEKVISKGWLTAGSLGKKLNSGNTHIKKAAEMYRNKHPKWFKVFGAHEFYHPNLCLLLSQPYTGIPDQWIARGDFMNKFGSRKSSEIKKILDNYRKSNPEWFKKIRKDIAVTEFISTELLEIVKNTVPLKEKKRF